MSEFKMTAEMKKALEGLLPMDNSVGYEYTPEVYKKKIFVEDGVDKKGNVITKEIDIIPEGMRPIFTIKQMSNKDINEFRLLMLSETKNSKTNKAVTVQDFDKKNQAYYTLLHNALIGWSNLYCLNSQTAIEYDGTIERMLELPEQILIDLLGRVVTITGFIPNGTF